MLIRGKWYLPLFFKMNCFYHLQRQIRWSYQYGISSMWIRLSHCLVLSLSFYRSLTLFPLSKIVILSPFLSRSHSSALGLTLRCSFALSGAQSPSSALQHKLKCGREEEDGWSWSRRLTISGRMVSPEKKSKIPEGGR